MDDHGKPVPKADHYTDSHAGDTSEECCVIVHYNVAAGEKIARVSANMVNGSGYGSACQFHSDHRRV